ncbi:MAG: branched-chain amino acid ABC transporter permease [Rhodospirillales bacterium]|nr:branched-chain amino acid ABC transporter permease [Rhodospirillales bacterium]MDH3790187.1 branched-chain amino acid ABC transporter permease [Rhodospirillales bacterium]MDH3909778.1 branched-chain amino acid ABC transporter permease [Rhodospirillales bacterium]MDH3920186.1 branched-chain amino acid ABC transporter permease [Rhodospirillales bacterium]MDH3969379.1 branched-chain amino acid ABC transporter permease [Rhodospirillales bacterium]
MDLTTFLIQTLNGVQYGFLLFLVASGLTLIFGIMGIINLAHGAFYMLGAYIVYWLMGYTDNLLIAVLVGLPIMLAVGYLIERFAISYLYDRDHLYQVLLTYGLILIFNELQKIFWGTDFYSVPVPSVLGGSVTLTETQVYPVYRLFISLICMTIAAGMYVLIGRTRLGMMIRAGASNREMAQVLGINIGRVFAIVFSLGAALAAFAGMVGAPISSVYPGMGDQILIISFVVVVIGGIGSIKGAFVGAMLIGLADTFGQVLLPDFASVVVYAVMALVLLWRPQGLFGKA